VAHGLRRGYQGYVRDEQRSPVVTGPRREQIVFGDERGDVQQQFARQIVLGRGYRDETAGRDRLFERDGQIPAHRETDYVRHAVVGERSEVVGDRP